jgi:hypothetical protein
MRYSSGERDNYRIEILHKCSLEVILDEEEVQVVLLLGAALAFHFIIYNIFIYSKER